MRRLIAVAGVLALGAGPAACGGENEAENDARLLVAPGPAVGAPANAEYAQPVLADHDDDVPTPKRGRVVAQNGFDRARDGFAFENYGPTLGGPQMRAQEMRELFGDGVCAGAAEDGCTLTPEAESWRTSMNANSLGGHCYGFSLLSEALRSGAVDETQYGATSTFDLRISTPRGLILNPELHADLSRSAVMQHIPAVKDRMKFLTANEGLEELRRGLNAGTGYVLGMFNPDPNNPTGHAVTPIAIEDMGDGRFDVVLYDNNYPHVPSEPAAADRRMRIDTKRNRWEYNGSLTPGAGSSLYYGEGTMNKMMLVREEDHRLPMPCPFCPGTAEARTVVGLTGDPADHGHLRITDPSGRVTGWDAGKYVNDIPGAEVERPLLSKVWLASPEPRYSLPAGRNYTVELVEVAEDMPEQAVHVTGPDVGVSLTGLAADANGTKLLLGPRGAVGLRPSSEDAIAGQLRVGAPGDRELRIDPSGERLQLRRARGDVLLSGSADRVDVVSAVTGRAATARRSTGRLDLDRLVGTRG